MVVADTLERAQYAASMVKIAYHDIRTIFIAEEDRIINPVGVKGLGELPIVGVAAAIANAVYHATGVRVRDLPIRIDKILV